jgi:hypothetical protein
MKTKYLLASSATIAVISIGINAMADSAATIETYANNTGVTYDDNGTGNYPVVTAVLSRPGTGDGYTYKNWSYLAADTTGSIDLFYASSLTQPYSPPTVGDTILVQGNYSPFDGIPEIANSGANPLTINGPGSSGNAPYAPGAPVLTTIPTINVGTSLPNGGGINTSGLAGYLLTLDDVTISGAGANWLTHANVTGAITDGSGNSMVMFLWASSYSSCGAIAASGGAVPTGSVDMTGFVDDFYNSSTGVTEAEFVPTSITAVPEPVAMPFLGGGLALVAGVFGSRLRRKA